MLATSCPNCGRPAPIRLGVTEVDCPACHVRSALEASVQARLAAAATVLDQVDARHRQFGRRSGWLITHTGLRAGLVGCGLLAMVVPFLAFAWVGWKLAMQQRGLEVADLTYIFPCATPLAFITLAVGLGMINLRRYARELREACAATPPSAPGEPAGCHVCGGAVAQQGTHPIARCGYCGADNVVTASDMAAAQTRRGESLDAFEGHLREHADAAGRGMRRLLMTTVLFATVAPMLGFCGGCCLSRSITEMKTEPNLDREYFWTDGPEGMRCIGYVDWREDTQARLRTPDCQRIGNSHPAMVANDALPEMFDITALEGRYLVSPAPHRAREGRVVSIHGRLDGRNMLTLRVAGERGARDVEMLPERCVCERVTEAR